LSITGFTNHVIIGLLSIVAGLKIAWLKSTTIIFESTWARGIYCRNSGMWHSKKRWTLEGLLQLVKNVRSSDP